MTNMTNCFGRIQTFGANCHTVHDAAAAENAERIFQASETLSCCLVTAVSQEAVCLQQTSRADELVGVPPERRAAGAAACTQDALVQTIQLGAIFRRLQTFDGRSWSIVDQIGFNLLELLVEDRHVNNQVADNRQSWQRTQNDLAVFGNLHGWRNTGQTIGAVDVHTIGATHTLAAGASVRKRRILLLDQ